ncbi:alpha/beta hydrolase [Microbacterium sp. Clip185]|uniref:alpha/beta hydrolase n=1 Tax=Microbacterium sp. Clip185 TaxID=3025663 RepID=UPI0023654923|nr:alpha/beta hydrolase [Microbacterium sp. Clip185]WDG19269.1 alpha/beta hydrolase [Microbacterium sp. Clip185]
MKNTRKGDPFVAAAARRVEEVARPVMGDSWRHGFPKDPVQRRSYAQRMDAAATEATGVAAPQVATQEHILPVSGYPEARLRVYWPTAEPLDSSSPVRLPVLVYFFGGSFTMGGIDWSGLDTMCRVRAAEARVIVVAGEYSLAPEVTYPAQPEQCWSVFEWAIAHAPEIGGDAGRIALGGASAGGNLAAAVTLMNRDRGGHPLRLQLLEVPALDLTGRHLDARAISPLMPGAVVRRMLRPIVRDYLGADSVSRAAPQPYASPLRARDHSGLPPALILTAERDVLRGDGEAYARVLAASGVPVTCVRYLGQDHGSAGHRRLNPAADDAHRQVVATLRSLHDDAVDYAEPPATAP